MATHMSARFQRHTDGLTFWAGRNISGCGTGFLTSVLATLARPRNGKVIAIDIFERQVEHFGVRLWNPFGVPGVCRRVPGCVPTSLDASQIMK